MEIGCLSEYLSEADSVFSACKNVLSVKENLTEILLINYKHNMTSVLLTAMSQNHYILGKCNYYNYKAETH